MAAQMQALHDGGTPYRDMTVLYRAHYLTRTVEEVLQREKIPYTIYSGVQFFGRAEIKDALSYLRMIACQDDLSFLRIVNQPKRNIGERAAAAAGAGRTGRLFTVHGPAPQCRHGGLPRHGCGTLRLAHRCLFVRLLRPVRLGGPVRHPA